MARDVQVRCRCGEVVGLVTNASPQKVNRVVCYCDDCQAFAHQLGRADRFLKAEEIGAPFL